MTTRKKKLFRD